MDIKTVIGLIVFILPGFLTGEVKNHLCHTRPPSQFEKTVQAVFFSWPPYLVLALIDQRWHPFDWDAMWGRV